MSTQSTPDQTDIRDTLAGDGEAYRRLIERYQQTIAQRLRRFSRDPRVIEELVHETFVQAWHSLSSYRASAPFEHWLSRIAVRAGYRYWKTRDSQKRTSPLAEVDPPALVARDASADAEVWEQVLDRLSPRDRLVVTLMYLEDRSVEETARLTGWSKTMVKVQAFRARGKLRKMMEKP